MLRKCMSLRIVARFTVVSFVDCERSKAVLRFKKKLYAIKVQALGALSLVPRHVTCFVSTDQHNEFMCLGTVEDAVGSNCFPEVFVDVVVCTAANQKILYQ